MSRYTITVTSEDRSDPDATIGYDPPLRTFFLLAFLDESGDDLELWLGTSDRCSKRSTPCTWRLFPEATASCHCPRTSLRCSVPDFADEAGRPPHDGPLAALLRHLRSR